MTEVDVSINIVILGEHSFSSPNEAMIIAFNKKLKQNLDSLNIYEGAAKIFIRLSNYLGKKLK
ncbi:hypothetical protein Anas_08482 [Armadillidium nasatum]|uniref:Uncharacterized protein n=1 Tax=Armadillidium nasatum TaxID=96803 RepID=A0A5N5SM24_9CRUS|nr:hypothetical protein Anas_08482 [Armadillidium nasatum]